MRRLKFGKFPRRLLNLFRRNRLESGLSAELQFHLQNRD